MSLPDGEPTVRVRDLIEVFSPNGSFGYFRVSSVAQRIGDVQDITLEHSIATLDDDLTAKEASLTGNMTTMLRQVLGWQTVERWELGDVECRTGGLALEADRITLREAVVSIVQLVDDYRIETEQTADRWLLHVRKMASAPSCECRLSRNAASVEIAIDDQELCTRVVSDALPDGEMRVDVTEWGVVTHAINIPAGASAAEAQRYATAYLKEHSTPNVAITIGAVELSALTGEAWDAFRLGDMCQTVLPDWGIVQTKRIIAKTWTDLLNAPTKVHLQLSKPARRIEEVVARSRSGGSRAAKQANDAETGLIIAAQAINELTGQLDTVYIRLDAAEKEIELKADKIALNGYVTAESLAAWGGTISATEMYGDIVRAASLWLNGTHVVTRSVQGTDGNTYRALVLSTAGD